MARVPFTTIGSDPGTLMPRLPLEIAFGDRSVRVAATVDSGASVNVLSYDVGLALGAVWEEQRYLGPLAGNLKNTESRALAVTCTIRGLDGSIDISLLFAWASSDSVPVLLGQTNFLMEFNVCFYRSQNFFEVWRA